MVTMQRKRDTSIIVLSIYLAFSLIGISHQTIAQQTTPCDSALSANLLNSERIAKKFGGYGIEILQSTPRLRVSNLYDGNKITRTLAIVDYPETIDTAFSKEHTEIVNGGSIGAVFKKHGWKIEKKNIYFGEIPTGDYKELYKHMGNMAPSKLSIWIYVFQIQKGSKQYAYATISEIYHPDFLSLTDLKCINKDAANYLQETPTVKKDLKKIKQLMKLESKK